MPGRRKRPPIPVTLTLPAEVIDKLQIEFYSDLARAAYKTLVE